MAYSIVKQGDTIQNYVLEFSCDYVSDIENLPTDCMPGSTCLVIENSSVYRLGSDGIWHEI